MSVTVKTMRGGGRSPPPRGVPPQMKRLPPSNPSQRLEIVADVASNSDGLKLVDLISPPAAFGAASAAAVAATAAAVAPAAPSPRGDTAIRSAAPAMHAAMPNLKR